MYTKHTKQPFNPSKSNARQTVLRWDQQGFRDTTKIQAKMKEKDDSSEGLISWAKTGFTKSKYQRTAVTLPWKKFRKRKIHKSKFVFQHGHSRKQTSTSQQLLKHGPQQNTPKCQMKPPSISALGSSTW